MGKAGRWLRTILAGKHKDDKAPRHHQQQQQGDATPLPPSASSPREKKRWSFRRAAPAAQGKPAARAGPSPLSSLEPAGASGEGFAAGLSAGSGREVDRLGQSEHAVAVAVAAAAAADEAVAAAEEAAAAVARLTWEEEGDASASFFFVEEAAAARIQATFRGYLARKALCALRGLVKLQALVRGQLVRRQATATLRRMQALVAAQSRLRAQRARMMLDEADHPAAYAAAAAATPQRRSPQHPRRRSSYEMDRTGEEHAKIVEMDVGEEQPRRGRSSCSAAAGESRERRLAEQYHNHHHHGGGGHCSPAPSSFAASELISPRAYSGHFEDLLGALDPAAPYATDVDDSAGGPVPSYMANTESSRAKARSQSAPRQRTADALERLPSRRRGGVPVSGAPRKTMQRSSSHVGVAGSGGGYPYLYQYGYGSQHQHPWAGVRLDRSSASLVGSECGSTTSVLTAATVGGYCRSLVGFEMHRGQY